LHVTGGDSYTWLPSGSLDNGTAGNPIATPVGTTTYSVIIRQGTCFTDTAYVTIRVNPSPTVNAGEDHDILAGTSIMLYANTTFTTEYSWTPVTTLSCGTCQNPTATPTQTTTYTVQVSNEFGCKAKDDVTIKIKCDNSLLFLANTFTPNGDGNNDRFYPQGKGIIKVKRFRIYNRWGELLYDVQDIDANDESMGWDGTYKGQPLKPDVYVYLVDAICFTGADIQQKGDISIVK
jgi:gliding motility-associated-like protein